MMRNRKPIFGRLGAVTFRILILLLGLFALNHGHPVVAQDQNEKPIELSGFSISQTYDITDDMPLDLSDPMLSRLVYRISKTSPKSRFAYGAYSKGISWSEIVSKTDDFRCRVFDRAGIVNHVSVQRMPGADADSEIKAVYISTITTMEGRPFAVVTSNVPMLWKSKFEQQELSLSEPVSFEGFLYARANIGGESQDSIPVFIAKSISWFPTEKNYKSIQNSHLTLAASGFDIGLLDLAKSSNTKPLGKKDAEAFYRMLATTRDIPDNGRESIGFQELMENASACFGQRIKVEGIARRCSIIKTVDPDVQGRLGLSHYYQLTIFPDLEGKNIVIRDKDGGEDINRRFPVTVCFTELPPGMTAKSIERKPLKIDGFVYRFWRFQSERTDQGGFDGQISPLVMTRMPVVKEQINRELDGLLFGFIFAVLAGICSLIFVYRASDQKHKSPGKKILEDLPDQIEVHNIEDVFDQPEFESGNELVIESENEHQSPFGVYEPADGTNYEDEAIDEDDERDITGEGDQRS